jgi:reactive intermediate/imine deaminase
MAESVARARFFRPIPLAANVLGDSARQYARSYERNSKRGSLLYLTGVAFQVGAVMAAQAFHCRPDPPFGCTEREERVWAFAGLSLAGLGFTIASIRAMQKAGRHAGQAILWHNRRFARPASAASAAPNDAPRFLNSGTVLPATLPFSEAVRVGNTLYLSGQIGITPGTMTLVPGGMEAQARQTMQNIRTTLAAHGYSMSNVVKCTVMLADMADWPAFNSVYQTFFTPPYPARSALGANGLALGALVEVECIAIGRGS